MEYLLFDPSFPDSDLEMDEDIRKWISERSSTCFMKVELEIILNIGEELCFHISNGVAVFKIEGKHYGIDETGKLLYVKLLGKWYDSVYIED